MRAVKKPIPIDVVEFTPTNFKTLPATLTLRPRFGNGPGWEIWNNLHQTWIGVDVGDMINITTPGDFYPIARVTFDTTYDVLDEAVPA